MLAIRTLSPSIGAEVRGIDLGVHPDDRPCVELDSSALGDDRCTPHHAASDHVPSRRAPERVTIVGDRTV